MTNPKVSDERVQQYATEELCEAHGIGVRCGVCDGILMARELLTLRSENERLSKQLGEMRQSRFKGTTVHSYGCHVSPDVESCRQNREKEPEGERLRDELELWLKKNKVVGILMDTEHHFVSISSAKLPPEIMPVLTHWGSIYVRNDSEYMYQAGYTPPAPGPTSTEEKAE